MMDADAVVKRSTRCNATLDRLCAQLGPYICKTVQFENKEAHEMVLDNK